MNSSLIPLLDAHLFLIRIIVFLLIRVVRIASNSTVKRTPSRNRNLPLRLAREAIESIREENVKFRCDCHLGKVIQSTRISEDLRVHLILKESGIVSSGCGAATSVLE